MLSINDPKSCNRIREVLADKIVSVNENGKFNLLLVADNGLYREITLDILTKRGHKVSFAKNGVDAVDYFLKKPFDIILMDVQMPEKNGYAETQTIRDIEHLSAS